MVKNSRITHPVQHIPFIIVVLLAVCILAFEQEFFGTGDTAYGKQARVVAGGEACCLVYPPDQAADVPDENYTDFNGDGIDGMRCGPIFVSPSGSDNNFGDINAPMRTISAAILAARSHSPRRDVYVANGTYLETVILSDGVNIFGGYDAEDGWSRSLTTRATVRISANGMDEAVLAANLTEAIVVDHLIFESDRDPGGTSPGATNAVALVTNCNESIQFTHCDFISNDGTPGTDGANGNAGANGENGSNSTGGNGGPGAGTKGGNGGSGGTIVNPPQSGQNGSGTSGGIGGVAGGPLGGAGGNGTNGANGTHGINGAGGSGFGDDGEDGTNGTHGSGGGGGGGGDGGGTPFGVGGNGGGGGGGGQRGTRGFGGTAGGSSCGIVIQNATADVSDSTFSIGIGGRGGAGGNGGAFGTSGSGANGGAPTELGGPGGDGGNGGRGGRGGHGGGGSGGNAIGILHLLGGNSIVDASTSFVTGNAGTGGASLGNDGANGIQANVHTTSLTTVPILPTCSPCCSPESTHVHMVMNAIDPDVTITVEISGDDGIELAGSATIVTQPSSGSASANANQLTYTPGKSFSDVDVFEYEACRGCGGCVNGFAIVFIVDTSIDCNENLVPDDCDIANGTSTDTNSNGVPDECDPVCPEDLVGNGVVNVDDLLVLIGAWGSCPGCPADLNADGVVNVDDLLMLIGAWGACA